MPEETSANIAKPKPKRRRTEAKSLRSAKTRAPAIKKEIDEQLAAIYLDERGEMPNMKQINMRPESKTLTGLLVVLGFGALLAAAAWMGFWFNGGVNNFSENQVNLSVLGPTEVTLGATSTYTIAYANNQTTALKAVTLIIRYPEGFVFITSSVPTANVGHNQIDLGVIPPKENKEIIISGFSYGVPREAQSWRVFLNYQPQNLNSELQKVAILNTMIGSSPISLALTGPASAMVGQEVEYIFTVNNGGSWRPDKLEIAPAFPDGFYVSSSTPALGKNNRWTMNLTSSTAAAKLIFKARGKFSNATENILKIMGTLYLPIATINQNFAIAETALNTELLKNDLSFSLAINGSTNNFDAHPGDLLNITLNLKNSSPRAFHNGVVTLILDTPSAKRQSLLNWPAIEDKYDGTIRGEQLNDAVRRGQIIWNNKKIPSLTTLNPGDEVVIDLRLPLKDANNSDLSLFSEYKMPVTAEIKFTDLNGAGQTVSANPIMITVNSDLKFETRDTVTTDAAAREVHNIEWILNNTFHPLKNIILTADVYGDIIWPSVSTTPAGTAQFDIDQKKITWSITEMPESIDVLAWPFTLTISKKNFSQTTLVSKVHVQAEDAITGEKLDFMGDETPLTPADSQ